MKIAVLGGHYLKNLCLSDSVWSINLPLSIDPRADNSIQRIIKEQCPFTPDLLLYADQGCLPMLTGFEDVTIPTAAYLVDTHLQFGWHRWFAGLFDAVYTAQLDALEGIAPRHAADCWLPLFSRDGDLKQETSKTRDVVFVGTVDPLKNSERVRFLQAFSQRMPLQIISGDYRTPFNEARIVLNQSVGTDINFRVFEAMACGSLLLTDDVGNGLDQLFQDGKHLVLYRKGDPDDAAAKADYYLNHAEQREAIAAAGHRLVVGSHTVQVRCAELLNKLETVWRTPGETELKRKGLAAGRTWLAIASLMTELEEQYGTGAYAPRAMWYRHLAEKAVGRSLAQQACDNRFFADLALLALLRGETTKAAAMVRLALLDLPDDIEVLLLAARIAGAMGNRHVAHARYEEAARLIAVESAGPGNRLRAGFYRESGQFCRRYLERQWGAGF